MRLIQLNTIKKRLSFYSFFFGFWVYGSLILFWVVPAFANTVDGIEILDANIKQSDTLEAGWVLNANFSIDLTQRLEEAVDRGVVLYFITEVDITRPRWYWFDEKIIGFSQTYRLSYHALTRQYRVSTGVLNQRFDSLEDALMSFQRLHQILIAKKEQIKLGQIYQLAIRMRLDTNQLPKPFQVNAMTSKEWSLNSDWRRFNFSFNN